MALDCILAVRLSAAFDCLTPATTGTSRDPKPRGMSPLSCRGVSSLYCSYKKSRITDLTENRGLDRFSFLTRACLPQRATPRTFKR
jgi:hypothetical protein